jgi:hypothetical protein
MPVDFKVVRCLAFHHIAYQPKLVAEVENMPPMQNRIVQPHIARMAAGKIGEGVASDPFFTMNLWN